MIELNNVFRMATMFRFQWEEAQKCYVLLYPEGMVKLNGPAGEILALVDGKTTLEGIISALDKKFPDAGGVQEDVQMFMQDALAQHWIEVVA